MVTVEKIISAKWLDYLYHESKKGNIPIDEASALFNALTVMMNANTVCTPFNRAPPGLIKEIGHDKVLDAVLKQLLKKQKKQRLHGKKALYDTSADNKETVVVQKIPAFGTQMCYIYDAQPEKAKDLHPGVKKFGKEILDELHEEDLLLAEDLPSLSPQQYSLELMHRRGKQRQNKPLNFTDDRYDRFERLLAPNAPRVNPLMSTPPSAGAFEDITQPDFLARQELPRYKKVITTRVTKKSQKATYDMTPKNVGDISEPLENAKRNILKIMSDLEDQISKTDTMVDSVQIQVNDSDFSGLPAPPNMNSV